MGTWTSDVWSSGDFLADLRSFVSAAVGGPVAFERVRHRPWSAVWRVTSDSGTAYVKQNCPGQAHEARLVTALTRVAPLQLVPVLAADTDRDLLLSADLGPTLQARGGSADVDTWCRVVAESATLQRRVADTGIDTGLTALVPSDASTYVADAVGRLGALAADDPRRLAPEVAHRLERLLPVLDRWADHVEDLGLPSTLVHNDLHAGNVLTLGGTLRFFDLGDAVVGEPLGNLLVPLRAAQVALGAAPDDPKLWRIADAALEVWSDRAPVAALRAALPSALRLACLARVESWRRCVATMTAEERREWGGLPAAWLGLLLEAPPLGATPSAAHT